MSRMLNDYQDFCDRFDALAKEAMSYGFSALVVFRDMDRLDRVEDTRVSYNNGAVMSLGMAEYARMYLKRDLEALVQYQIETSKSPYDPPEE